MKTQLLKSISSLLFLAFATSTSVAQTAEKPSGSGTEEDPYQIATLGNLYWMSQNAIGHFMQTADIDASETSTWDVGDHDRDRSTPDQPQGWSPAWLGGTYNGNGHTIDGLTINRPTEKRIGLFGHLSWDPMSMGEKPEIQNLGLTNVQIHGEEYVGALVGQWEIFTGQPITNCYATGNVIGDSQVGGLVGTLGGMHSGELTDSHSDCTVRGGQEVGGLVGALNEGTIRSSYNAGDVSGEGQVGGLVGSISRFGSGGIISSSYSAGEVRGQTRLGGLVGWNSRGYVINSYSTGSIAAEDTSYSLNQSGGLVGVQDYNGEVINCYSTSSVSGDSNSTELGGFMGVNEGIITNSFWDIESSGIDSSAGGQGKTTTQMKRMGTYTSAGWDFESETTNGADNYWDLDMSGVINDGYPYLWWQDGDATSLDVSDAPVLPDGFAIHQNYPNPFNPTTTISYDLPKRSLVTIGIYNLLGKQIKTLVNQSQDAGNKIAVWNGTDDLGRQVSAGVYLYRIQAGEFTQTRKMLFLK